VTPKRKSYRVGPNCETWPNILTKIPIKALKLAHNLGQPCTIFVLSQRGSASLSTDFDACRSEPFELT
jgi:hypothetical protein